MQSASNPFAGGLPGNQVGAVSEDCLTLDVWVPPGRPPAGGWPVLVWVPGGAFLTGGSAVETYDGAALAAGGELVLVSVNYRLGVFGFCWVEGGDANCGLLDLLAALRWTRDNIGAFGGDHTRVTLVGESAGAGSVLHLLPAAAAERLVIRAVLQSPGVGHTLDAGAAEAVKAAVLAAAGVASDEELWRLPAPALLDAQERALPGLLATVGAMPFHPVVDGRVVAERPADRWPVPVGVLVSWTAEEMRLYPDRGADDPEGLRGRLRSLLRARGVDPTAGATRSLLDFYGDAGGGADIWAAAQTDALMRLPARRVALCLASGPDAPPVHLAQWDWGAEGGEWRRGAFHAIDLPFTFGTLDRAGWLEFLGAAGPDDRGARRAAEHHMAAWAAYVRTGDPGWPPATAKTTPVRRFAPDPETTGDPLVGAAHVWNAVAGTGWPPL
jgi:para-nitrobenzyl esterase